MDEVFLALLGLAVFGLLLLVPIFLIVALVRTGRLRRQVAALESAVARLEARLQARERRAEAVAAPGGAEPESALVSSPQAMRAASPARESVPSAPLAPPPVVAPAPVVKAAVLPQVPVPPPTVAPPRPSVAPPPRPAGPPPPAPPPPPASPAFDWESLLGLRGAAWAGGIALVIAGLLFAKLAIDRGFFTPELRVVTMLVFGVGSLIGAEISLRRGFATTANAVSAAGIAILYACFFAAHALYGLLPLALTFGLMVLVTVVACVLAVRYDAWIVAVLGLLGGFATPLALSTGVDRPIGLFAYILLLNLGLMTVALRQRWHGLLLLTLAGTLVIELGWFVRFMSPEKMLIGLLVFLVFGLLYLFLPARVGESGLAAQAGILGGVAPFCFAFLLAVNPVYAGEWPLLFGFIAILDAALVFVALKRDRPLLLLGGALATGITLPMWAGQGLKADDVWGPSLVAVGLLALLNVPARLGRWFEAARDASRRGLLEAAGLLTACGVGLFALVLVARDLGEPPWAFLVLLAALVAALFERTRAGRLPGVAVLGALGLGALVQVWFFAATGGPALLRNLAVPLLLALALSLVAGRRAPASTPGARNEDEAGVVGSAAIALGGLFACLLSGELGGAPWPLFTALAVIDLLLVVSALRRDWTPLLPLTLLASAFLASCWQETRFHPLDLAVVLPIYAAFYLAFLALPFALSARLAPHWRERVSPWLASALAGPLYFLPLYRATTRGWGQAAIGLLPVAMAALSVAALFALVRRFGAAQAGEDPASRRRLSRLALFAAVALGFVALAIPLQLDRQWITVAWALEAAAVWWLLGRLPHSGLRAFGGLLFAAVTVRLLFNWDNLLRYQERGLPILNWLLYTYGVPAACCLVGARFLRKAESAGPLAPWRGLAAGTAFAGLVLIFALINLEIADFFSAGRYLEFSQERAYARDLTTSLAWGLYAFVLLLLGVWRRMRALRMIALGFLVLTVFKVFLYDLSNLGGFARVLSFLGLGIGLIVVSLLYQRFVIKEARS